MQHAARPPAALLGALPAAGGTVALRHTWCSVWLLSAWMLPSGQSPVMKGPVQRASVALCSGSDCGAGGVLGKLRHLRSDPACRDHLHTACGQAARAGGGAGHTHPGRVDVCLRVRCAALPRRHQEAQAQQLRLLVRAQVLSQAATAHAQQAARARGTARHVRQLAARQGGVQIGARVSAGGRGRAGGRRGDAWPWMRGREAASAPPLGPVGSVKQLPPRAAPCQGQRCASAGPAPRIHPLRALHAPDRLGSVRRIEADGRDWIREQPCHGLHRQVGGRPQQLQRAAHRDGIVHRLRKGKGRTTHSRLTSSQAAHSRACMAPSEDPHTHHRRRRTACLQTTARTSAAM